MSKKTAENNSRKVSFRDRSGAIGGPSTARGVDYQLDYAVYHTLALMAEQLGRPSQDVRITIEPRQLHAQNSTRSDIRITSTRTSTELKLHPSRADILEWIKRVAADPSVERHELVFATTSGTLLTSLDALLRLAREVGNDTGHLKRLANRENIKDRARLLTPFGVSAATRLNRLTLQHLPESVVQENIVIRAQLLAPEHWTLLVAALKAEFLLGMKNRKTYRFTTLIEQLKITGIKLRTPKAHTRTTLAARTALRNKFVQTAADTVHALTTNYVERPEALLALRKQLVGHESNRAFGVAMCGMGGIGKTVLAQALTHDDVVRRAFPDGIAWSTVGKNPPSDLTTRMQALLRALGSLPSEDESELECIQRYRAVMRKKRVLIILDDIWRPEHLDPFVVDSSRPRLLFTTRNSRIADIPGAVKVEVDVLSIDESRSMLARYSDRSVGELARVAEDLISECGRLPLGLAMIGAMVRGKHDKYWALTLKQLRSADLAKINRKLPNYPYENLQRAIQMSVDALSQKARRCYFALAVLLDDMAAMPAIQQTLWNTDEFDALETAEELVGLSLAHRDKEGTGILLHDLQHDYLCDQYPDRVALGIIHGAVRLSVGAMQNDSSQFASQVVGRLLPRNNVPAIKHFIAGTIAGAPSPWLRPLLDALEPPGGPLFPPREGHRAGVLGVALTKNGRRAISFSEDETLKVWDLETARELLTLRGHRSAVYCVALSADGRYVVSASSDKTIKVWDLDSAREIRTLVGHSRGVSHVVVSPDFRRALSASWDMTLKLWDIETGVELENFAGHSKSVNCVAVNADWTLAVSASEDATLRVWNLKTCRQIRTLKGHTADVWSVALTADGEMAVSASEDQQLRVWNVKTGRTVRILKGHTSAVYGVALSPDNRFAVSASDDTTVRVWDPRSGRQLQVLRGHSTVVCGVAVSDDSRFAISTSYDATLKEWDLETGTELRTLEGHCDGLNAVAVSEDGARGVFASDDKTLKVWDLKAGRTGRTLTGHTSFIYDVVISRDGMRAISASADETVRIWNLEAGTEIGMLCGHTSFVQAVAASGDFRLAVSASDDKTLKVWDLETAAMIRTLRGHDSSIYSVALTADGRRVASASYDATVRIWDVESGLELHRLKHHKEPVNVVAFSPDGRVGVSASDDCLVGDDSALKVWDVETGRLLRAIGGHADSVSSLAFSADGTHLLSASWDKTLKVWNFETGSLVTTFTCDAPVTCCRFIKDQRVIAGDHLGRVHLLSLELT